MSSRINYQKVAPELFKGLYETERLLADCGLEKPLLELVKTRDSQINKCAYCLDMHSKDALKAGETFQRLISLDAWREAPYYSERERAALEWTEAVTQIATHDVSDEIYSKVKAQFTDKEMVALTLSVIAINSWNRLAIPFRTEAGTYQPK